MNPRKNLFIHFSPKFVYVISESNCLNLPSQTECVEAQVKLAVWSEPMADWLKSTYTPKRLESLLLLKPSLSHYEKIFVSGHFWHCAKETSAEDCVTTTKKYYESCMNAHETLTSASCHEIGVFLLLLDDGKHISAIPQKSTPALPRKSFGLDFHIDNLEEPVIAEGSSDIFDNPRLSSKVIKLIIAVVCFGVALIGALIKYFICRYCGVYFDSDESESNPENIPVDSSNPEFFPPPENSGIPPPYGEIDVPNAHPPANKIYGMTQI